MPPRFSLLTTQRVCFPVSVFFLYITPQQHFCEKRWSKFTKLYITNGVSMLQTTFRNRERHEARRIGLEPMPLDQHIASGHRERQACLKIRPAPMHHLL